jgi:hypothetical protein
MKTKIRILALAAIVLLPSCSSPFSGPDQLDIGIARSAEQQQAAAAEISRNMALSGASRAPSYRLAPLQPLQPIY